MVYYFKYFQHELNKSTLLILLQVKGDYEEEINIAASFLIREWVEKLLGVKFNSLRDLAVYLIEKMYVDNRSTAAYTVIRAMEKSDEGNQNYLSSRL